MFGSSGSVVRSVVFRSVAVVLSVSLAVGVGELPATAAPGLVRAAVAAAPAGDPVGGPAGAAGLPADAAHPVTPAAPGADFTPTPVPGAVDSALVRPPVAPRLPAVAVTGFVAGKSVLASRSAEANVYRNPDGTTTVRSYDGVVNVPSQADPSVLVPVDTTLRPVGGALVPAEVGALVRLPAAMGLGAVMSVASTVTAAAGGSRVAAPAVTVGFEGLLPSVAKVAGSTATYAGVAPGVDLQLSAVSAGVQDVMVLRRAPLVPRWTYKLGVGAGLVPSQDPAGAVVFTDTAGVVAQTIPAPTMWDAKIDPVKGEPAYGPVTQTLRRDADGWRLTVTADPGWLADPSRVYPVSVDPTVVKVGAAFDTFVSSAYPTTSYNSRYNSSTGFYDMSVGYFDGTTGTNWAYVNYAANDWAGQDILGATWHGFWDHSYSSTPTLYRMRNVPNGWNPDSATWNTKAAYGSYVFDGNAAKNQWTSNDVTDYITAAANGSVPYFGFMVETGGQGQGSWKKLVASESGASKNASYLEVTYNRAPTQPTIANGSPGDGASFHQNNYGLLVSATDPDGDDRHVEITASLNADMSAPFSGTSVNLTGSASTAGWSIPDLAGLCGCTVWNKPVYWRASSEDASSNVVYSKVYSFTPRDVGPTIPTPTAPGDKDVTVTATPTLSATPGTDADGDALTTQFQISTGADGQSGLVARSGWANQSGWTVPPGVLKDGVTYYWTVQTRAAAPFQGSGFSAPRALRVDRRLGAQGPVPGDSTGPVGVNLATGNVGTAISTPGVATVGGNLGVGFTYNSQAATTGGLTGSYYTGDSTGNPGIAATERPALVRTDAAIDFNWGTGSPYAPALGNDTFRTRWDGYLQAPTAGDYFFGGVRDDGMRVWVDDTIVYDHWTDREQQAGDAPAFDTKVTLDTRPHKIRVEFREVVGLAFVTLWVRTPNGSTLPVPASWFSTAQSGLPAGWTLSAAVDGTGGSYVRATLTDGAVAVIDDTGASHAYTRTGDGGFTPPPGEYATLTRDRAGNLTLVDADGTTSVFDTTGNLIQVTAPSDARHPANTVLTYSSPTAGNPVTRLTQVTDPLSGRNLKLVYSGDPRCPAPPAGFGAVPENVLCAVQIPNPTDPNAVDVTELDYSNGLLAQVANPGGDNTQLGYTNGLLTQVRTSLSADAAAADPGKNTDAVNYRLGYTTPDPTSGTPAKATWVEAPEPTGYPQNPTRRPRHDYTYAAGATTMTVAGLSPSAGFARKVTLDAAGRMLTDTDAANLTTTYSWFGDDRPRSSTDPAGRKSSTTYDASDNPTETYGPAPAVCFTGDTPTAPAPPGCEVPNTSTRYDEAITGLSGSFYPNTTMTGAPSVFATAAPNTDWSATAPAPTLTAGGSYSGRLTGKVTAPTAGVYTLATAEADATQGARVFVDDQLVLDRSYPSTVLADDPLAYYRMGNAANSPDTGYTDVTGGGRNGTLSGGYTVNPQGMTPDDNNRAVSFTGGAATVADSDALDITGDLSIDLWVYAQNTNAYNILISKYGGADTAAMPYELALRPDGVPQFEQNGATGAGFTSVAGSAPVTWGAWNHLALTRSSTGAVTFYLNGAKAGTATIPVAAAANSGAMTISGRNNGQGARAVIDNVALYNTVLDEKVIAAHAGTDRGVGTGYQSLSAPAATLTQGTHRIRIDTVHRARTGNQSTEGSGINLTWRTPGTSSFAPIPATSLVPDYGLVTSTTVHESGAVPDQTSATSYTGGGLDPAYGLPTATTADPGGLNLTESTTYEPAGTGFLRRLTKTMPSGAVTTDAYYPVGQTRANPCVSGAPAIDQGGMARTTTDATPATGGGHVNEQVYDNRGRVVASATSGSWICTTYDNRERVVTTTTPSNATTSARTERAVYAVGGDPLTTSVSDEKGTITTVVDLDGRVISSTDVWGTTTVTDYTRDGRATSETVTPPNPADPAQTLSWGYDQAGRMLTQTLNGATTPQARTVYDTTTGETSSVAYGNGATLSSITRDNRGATTGLTYHPVMGADVTSTVVRTRSGRIADETLGGIDPSPSAPSYTYDTVGRLTRAVVTGHTLAYDFTSTTTAGCPTGAAAAAAKNSNRMGVTDTPSTGAATTSRSCYDNADRLIGTTGTGAGAKISTVAYDPEGDTTTLVNTGDGTTTTLSWDAGHRNTAAQVTGTAAQNASSGYARDATDRVIARTTSTATGTTNLRYSFTGDGDSGDLVLDATNRILTRTFALPGGVLLTVPGTISAGNTTGAGETGTPAQPTWDAPTIRGDLALTWNNAGTQTGALRTQGPGKVGK